MDKFHIFVFSFNRGEFLQNCIASIKQCTDLPLTIIDDNSYDPTTLSILADESAGYDVIRVGASDGTHKRTGGLHGNMQLAMDMCRKNGIDYTIFIQDDMQFVRNITKHDLDSAVRFFEDKSALVISANFMKKVFVKHDVKRTSLDSSQVSYTRAPIGPGRFYFSDIGVFSVDRLSNSFGSFEIGEKKNEKKSRDLGLKVGMSAYPFMMWLPYPKSLRERTRSATHALMERITGAGFHPIEIMSAAENDAFIKRNPEILPFAEDFLRSRSAPRKDVWSTEGGISNLLCRGGWRKILGMVMMRTNRLLG